MRWGLPFAAAVLSAWVSAWPEAPSVFSNAEGSVRVEYDLGSGTASLFFRGVRRISGAFASATLAGGPVRSTDYPTRTLASNAFTDGIGKGIRFDVTGSGSGPAVMRQTFFLYDHEDFLLLETGLTGSALSCNRISPLSMATVGGVDVGGTDPRALEVPWDNDNFVGYNAGPLGRTGTSNEVAAFYDNASRNGLIAGSVTHEVWKTGVDFTGESSKLNALDIYGGANGPRTRDIVPHGSLSGSALVSPRIFVGFYADWRDGMERFADINAAITPPLPWSGGAPFGWNSWGELATKVDYGKATAVSDFFKANLQNHSFHGTGAVYINLDSYWDNLSDQQLTQFVQHCRANGQKAGIYFTPFANWGIPGNTQAALRYNADSLIQYDGAYSLDPTHPWTRQRIKDFFDRMKGKGFEYAKLDFTDNGAQESRSHYDPSVMTGIQAYNQGMRYIDSVNNGAMFLNLSISPLFPFAQAHGRRIACDAFGDINHIKYTLNSVTYGWWMGGRMYAFNDPDHLCLRWSENEARSRITTGVITGSNLLGDDLTDTARQARAVRFATNAGMDSVGRMGRAFRPVEGNTGTDPSDAFTMVDGATGTLYVAVFNYANAPVSKSIPLARLGAKGSNVVFDELWTGARVTANGALAVTLEAYDCRLFRSAPGAVAVRKVGMSPYMIRPLLRAVNVLGERLPWEGWGAGVRLDWDGVRLILK